MALNDLSEEQKKQLKKMYRSYAIKICLNICFYLGFIFLANLVVAILNFLYIKEQQFVFFMCLGTAVIGMNGLNKTIKEDNDIVAKKIKDIRDSK